MSQLVRTLTGQSHNSTQTQETAHSKGQHLTPVGSTLTRTTTTDPLSGVLNHLSAAQVRKLDEFKEKLQKDGWWAPEGVNGKASHDDGTLLRYLRARKFDVTGAIGQFTDTEKWMKEQRIDELYEHFDVEIYERARVMYPQWTGHRDRRGIPIYVYVIKGLDSKQVSKYQKESQKYKDSLPSHKKLPTAAKQLPLFALYHNLLNYVLPMVSTLERPNPEIPVTNSTNIVDISGVGLTQFWNLKNHMQDASVLATAHYPETLDRIFIIGAPSFFPTVWGWIKRWFDPVTVSKIFILGKHEIKPTLEKFMEPKDIPKKYGGTLDWDWGQLPDLDAETREALETDGNKGWVRGPCLWLDHQRVVVGSENGKARAPDRLIAEKKPIVYAADYTEEPVHAEKRSSGSGGAANGQLRPANGLERKPSSGAVKAAQIASGAAAGSGIAAAASTSKSTSKPTSKRQSKELERAPAPSEEAPSCNTADLKRENLRAAPIDGSPIHVPDQQAAPPAVTVEYVSKSHEALPNGTATPTENKVSAPETTVSDPVATAHEIAPTATAAAVEENTQHMEQDSQSSRAPSTHAAVTYSHVPAVPAPGPMAKHEAAATKVTAGKLEGESQSEIPADANGAFAHPDVLVASDKSKGLAVESEKLGQLGVAARPGMERFVTAAEF